MSCCGSTSIRLCNRGGRYYIHARVVLNLLPGLPMSLPCSPLAAQSVLKESAEGGVGKLDEYEIEGEASQEETLQNLTEFQLAAVRHRRSPTACP